MNQKKAVTRIPARRQILKYVFSSLPCPELTSQHRHEFHIPQCNLVQRRAGDAHWVIRLQKRSRKDLDEHPKES